MLPSWLARCQQRTIYITISLSLYLSLSLSLFIYIYIHRIYIYIYIYIYKSCISSNIIIIIYIYTHVYMYSSLSLYIYIYIYIYVTSRNLPTSHADTICVPTLRRSSALPARTTHDTHYSTALITHHTYDIGCCTYHTLHMLAMHALASLLIPCRHNAHLTA